MSLPIPFQPFARDRDVISSPLVGDHVACLYRDDSDLVDIVAEYAGQGLGREEAVVLIVTAEHRRAITARLRGRHFAVDGLVRVGRLIFGDARELLNAVLREGAPDAELFRFMVGDLVTQAVRASHPRPPRLFGEMVDLLWQEDRVDAAAALETLWNDLLEERPATLLCAYQSGTDLRPAARPFPDALRRAHTHLL